VARPDHAPGADRGMILAHQAVWEHFVGSRETNVERKKIDEKDDIMLVFEDDLYPMVENHQLNTLLEVNRMQSDLHWLGWCYYHDNVNRSPLCMHAYAVSVIGARSLINSVKPCGPLPLDRQVRLMCDGNTTWSITNGEWEYRTHHSDFFRNRMSDAGSFSPICPVCLVRLARLVVCCVLCTPHISTYFLTPLLSTPPLTGIFVTDLMHYGGYGGIYTQAKFEKPAMDDPKIAGHVALVKNKKHKGIHLSINGNLHLFPDMDVFLDMGYKWTEVYHITNWKFATLPNIGETVSVEFCKHNRCKLGPLPLPAE
jgi:hypothetical protein